MAIGAGVGGVLLAGYTVLTVGSAIVEGIIGGVDDEIIAALGVDETVPFADPNLVLRIGHITPQFLVEGKDNKQEYLLGVAPDKEGTYVPVLQLPTGEWAYSKNLGILQYGSKEWFLCDGVKYNKEGFSYAVGWKSSKRDRAQNHFTFETANGEPGAKFFQDSAEYTLIPHFVPATKSAFGDWSYTDNFSIKCDPETRGIS